MANKSGELSEKRKGQRNFPAGRIFDFAHQGVILIYPMIWEDGAETKQQKTESQLKWGG